MRNLGYGMKVSKGGGKQPRPNPNAPKPDLSRTPRDNATNRATGNKSAVRGSGRANQKSGLV